MSVKLLYFAWLRERLGVSEETVELAADVVSVSDLLNWLKERDEVYADAFEHADIIQLAIDKRHIQDRETDITNAKEIAIFPPMTGG